MRRQRQAKRKIKLQLQISAVISDQDDISEHDSYQNSQNGSRQLKQIKFANDTLSVDSMESMKDRYLKMENKTPRNNRSSTNLQAAKKASVQNNFSSA